MFAVNIKLGLRKPAVFLLAVTAAVTAAVIIRLEAAPKQTKTAAVYTDAESVVGYLNSFGLEIEPSAGVFDEIRIPEEFGDVYENYNKIQKSQGFDLSEFKGQVLTRYTFPVTNYPEPEYHVFAEVLVSGGSVVAADIYSTNAEGFIKALK